MDVKNFNASLKNANFTLKYNEVKKMNSLHLNNNKKARCIWHYNKMKTTIEKFLQVILTLCFCVFSPPHVLRLSDFTEINTNSQIKT